MLNAKVRATPGKDIIVTRPMPHMREIMAEHLDPSPITVGDNALLWQGPDATTTLNGQEIKTINATSYPWLQTSIMRAHDFPMIALDYAALASLKTTSKAVFS